MARPDKQRDRDDRDEEYEDEAPPERGRGPKPRANSARPRDDEDDPPPRKPVTDRKVPYPTSPTDVPDGLTDYADSYTQQQNLLLAGLFVFLMFYIGAVFFFALIGAWCVWSFGHYPPLKVVGIVFSSVFFLFLVKGFFKRPPMNKDMHIEITADEHPVLFEFIYHLCDELGAPTPNKVYVSPDVNAAVMPQTSLINLFVEPKKDLLIGLGLVNSVNLSEFKAVLAHEFGHFSQSAMASSYTYVAGRIIGDLVEGEDWFDRVVNWCKRQDNAISLIGYAIGAPLWVGRKLLEWFYKAITLQRLAVSREREFHADLVAVSAAGSNAVVHCLLRTEFGHQCFMQALNDLATALDHKLYSNDMYLHQDRAAAIVRRKKKEPQLGLPPALKTDNDGKNVEVFDAEQEEMEDEIPPMWRTHPSNSDREKNAKDQFVPAVVDHRSPWILFDEPADLKERMTYKFYRMVFKIPKNADLADAVKVQRFIDNEHADTTYDPKYKGCYDDRPLEPGELAELNGIIRDKPWDDDRMEKVLAKLYDGCEEHAEAHSELYKEMQSLQSSIVGRPSPKMKRKMEEIEKKQDENWEWFKSFDRRVYLLHVQMAACVDKELKDELVERYRFQLEVQRLYQESRNAFNKADAYLGAYAAASRGEINVGPDFAAEVIQTLREQWKVLKKIVKDARDINLPAMKNFEEGENLADFILEGKMVPEPPLSYVKGVWIDKLMTQLQGVRQKCFRLHFKSVGGILKLQEQIAAKWKASREPVAAEVIDAEPIAAEVIDAEPIPAEVVPAEVVPAEVVPAEVIDEPIAAEVIEAEVLPPPTDAPPTPEPPKSVAAFVAPAVAPVARPEYRSTIPLVPPPAPEPPVAPSPASAAPVVPSPAFAVSGVPAKPQAAAEPEIIAAEVVEAEVVEAEVVEAEVIEAAVVEPEPPGAVFDLAALDAQPAPKPPEPAPAPQPEPKAPPKFSSKASMTFDLDSGLPLPVPAKGSSPATPIVPAPAVPSSEVFNLDAEAQHPDPVTFSLDADDNKPAAKSAPKSGSTPALSGVAPTPVLRTPAMVAKPASGKRPPIKITMVRPGESSPLAKG
jgi:Zn-dependent protease with chaperone function